MLITKEIEIDMAHRVPFHQSKCRNLHWHRYKIEVWVDDKLIDEYWHPAQWMVIDFSDLKAVMMEVLDDKFDHWAVFYEEDLYVYYMQKMIGIWDQNPNKMHYVNFIPTAENLCKYWFWLLKPELEERWVAIFHCKIWETPTSTAIYTINEFNSDYNKKCEEDRIESVKKYNELQETPF